MIKNKTGKLDNRVKKGQWTVPSFFLIVLFIIIYPVLSFAEGLDPYSFSPKSELRPQEYLPSLLPPLLRHDSTKTLNRLHAAPNPVVVTDEDGNVSIYQGGELKLKIDTRGNKTYYLNNLPQYEKDDTGYLTRTYEYSGARATVKNEWGEVVAYQEYGLGGLLLRGYDEKGRLTQVYEYDGKKLKSMIDKLTNSRTLYNERGKVDREENFQGAITAQYYYSTNGKLLYKVDLSGNKTTYDSMGREQFIYDHTGAVTATYEWTSMNKYKMADQYGNTTYVDHGRTQYKTNSAGVITEQFNWQGTKLISSTDVLKDETTYYENGRLTEMLYRGEDGNLRIGTIWKYDEETGILIARLEHNRLDGDLLIYYYDHGRTGNESTLRLAGATECPAELTRDYQPPHYDEIIAITRQHKDTNHSIAPDIEELLREMAQNNG